MDLIPLIRGISGNIYHNWNLSKTLVNVPVLAKRTMGLLILSASQHSSICREDCQQHPHVEPAWFLGVSHSLSKLT